MKKSLIIPFFISMEGCISRCIYCNQYILKEHDLNETVEQTVSKYLSYSKNVEHIELAFFGGTFLNLSEKKMDDFLKSAFNLKEKKLIDSVRISTTPESVNEKKCKKIRGIVDSVELGIQTLDDRLLQLLGRRYNKKICFENTLLLREYNFKIGYQLMLGLPTQHFNSFADTIKEVNIIKPDFLRLYPLMVIYKTKLYNYIRLNILGYPNLDYILEQGAYALLSFYKNRIPVIKVGLTEFFDEKDISDGFMIKNWRIEMESLLWYKYLKRIFLDISSKYFTIICSKRDYESIVGISKKNLAKFYNDGLKVKVDYRNDIDRFYVIIDDKKYFLFDAELSDLFNIKKI